MGGLADILKRHGVLAWLVGINALLYFIVAIASIAARSGAGYEAQIAWLLALPASLDSWLHRPWTIITYMFVHENFLHLLFNMLWLLWFGDLFARSGYGGSRSIFWLYIGGGIAGGVLYMVCMPLFPALYAGIPVLLGASAAVLALMSATAVLMPDYRLHLFFIGDVKLKWIALAMIALAFIGLGGGNMGGEIAHIGGVIFGIAAGLFYKRPAVAKKSKKQPRRKNPFKDFTPDPGRREAVRVPAHNAEEQERANVRRLDQLLDKIRISGYNSLTRSERAELDELSKKITK